jgi:hypothetical protein
MAVEKSLAATCCPVAGVLELLAGASDEQALTPVTATIADSASAAAASLRDHDRVGWIGIVLAPLMEKGDLMEGGI